MNSISISRMLTGQWNVKQLWPPIEGNFVRQFQSPTQACTSVLVFHATFYIFCRVFCENTHKTFPQKTEMSLRISNIFRQKSNRVTSYVFSRKNFQADEKHGKTVSKNYFSKLLSVRPLFTVNLPSLDNLAQFLGHTAIMTLKYSIK